MKNLLTIAGSDSSGGAGIQADLKTFSALGTYGMSAITAITAQNTRGVWLVQEMSPEMVRLQINCLFEDIPVHAVKIGMVSNAEIIAAIGECLVKHRAGNIVVDPVMVSKSKHQLLRPEACQALVEILLPLAEVVTPNIPEAEALIGKKINTQEDMMEAAVDIHKLGAKNVVLKGGHLDGPAVDILFNGKEPTLYHGNRVNTKNTHGTGCTFSSAIAAFLARGLTVSEAVAAAKEYISIAIANSLDLGQGAGPTHHFYQLYKRAGVVI